MNGCEEKNKRQSGEFRSSSVCPKKSSWKTRMTFIISPESLTKIWPALIHALRVHQIELKMQNEELRRIQEELERTKSRYSHLYDFSPVGYLTVNEKGAITEINLTMTLMLGFEREDLIGKMFSHFIMNEDQDIFYRSRQNLMRAEIPEIFELRLLKKDRHPFFARMECMILKSGVDESMEIRAAVSDISDRKLAENERDILRDQLLQSQKLESIGTLAGGIAT